MIKELMHDPIFLVGESEVEKKKICRSNERDIKVDYELHSF